MIHPVQLVMDQANWFAKQSRHPRSRVGCAIHSWQSEESVGGYNAEMTEGVWIHAEAMAVSRAARSGLCTYKSTMGINWFPCVECAVLIANAGIVRLCYDEMAAKLRWDDPKYQFQKAHDYLTLMGVELIPVHT